MSLKIVPTIGRGRRCCRYNDADPGFCPSPETCLVYRSGTLAPVSLDSCQVSQDSKKDVGASAEQVHNLSVRGRNLVQCVELIVLILMGILNHSMYQILSVPMRTSGLNRGRRWRGVCLFPCVRTNSGTRRAGRIVSSGSTSGSTTRATGPWPSSGTKFNMKMLRQYYKGKTQYHRSDIRIK